MTNTMFEKVMGFAPGMVLLIGASLFLSGCTKETAERNIAQTKGPKHWNVEFAAAISKSFR